MKLMILGRPHKNQQESHLKRFNAKATIPTVSSQYNTWNRLLTWHLKQSTNWWNGPQKKSSELQSKRFSFSHHKCLKRSNAIFIDIKWIIRIQILAGLLWAMCSGENALFCITFAIACHIRHKANSHLSCGQIMDQTSQNLDLISNSSTEVYRMIYGNSKSL